MSAHTYAYTLKPSGPTGARSFAIIAAAIMAVGVLSSVPVMRELVGSVPARATTAVTALASDFQSRWWPGETQQVTRQASTVPNRQPSTVPNRPAPTVPESDLTFAKGYSLRLAARQAASATGPVASGPSSESQFGRSAIVVRNATTVARTDGAPNLRRVPALVDRPGPLDSGSHALAFGEQRPSPRGSAQPQGGPFASLFGNPY
jgi:hypothetical protein